MPLHPIHALDEVIAEYREYLRTEFRAKDPNLMAALERELDKPLFLAQEAFFQAHRPFKNGKPWRDLPLDPKLAKVMTKRAGTEFAYTHQSDAIERLLSPDAGPVVVTTGTGSGKTEAFLLPVIQNAIADASHFKQNGLTAILVYPMNALANDQLLRIQEYLEDSGFDGVVKVAKYDRSTKQSEREELRRNPPHILLTNYMMLEYLLVRPADREGIFANHRCRILVLDEVHTYRGSLGANIALLIRRVRTHLGRATQTWKPDVSDSEHGIRYPMLIPIGTSATIKSIAESDKSPEEMRRLRDEDIREFFSKLTGAEHNSIAVYGEELQSIDIPSEAHYSTQPVAIDDLDIGDSESVRTALCKLSDQPLTTPIEEAVRGCRMLWDLNRWLIQKPMSVHEIVGKIRAEIPERKDWSDEAIADEVTKLLTIGAALPDGLVGALRLRVHRFIRGGWRFHRCINPACGKLHPMGEEKCSECGSFTAPLLLCRNCGADYLRFVGDIEKGGLRPSAIMAEPNEWLLFQPEKFVTKDMDDEEGTFDDIDDSQGAGRLRQGQIKGKKILNGSFSSTSLTFSADPADYDIKATMVPARTKCMCCGGTAGNRSVITPVAIGTSAAVKVLSEGLVESLAEANVDKPGHDGKERLLVFSDSRQDAAHQARFIIFASRYDRMRRRVYQLLNQHESLTLEQTVRFLSDLGLKAHDNPYAPGEETKWINDDLRRKMQVWEEAPLLDDIAVNAGYRATIINLGLVGIEYHELDEYVKQMGEALAGRIGITVSDLAYICHCMLNEMRVRGCLSRELLRYHPLNTTCPDYFAQAEWERKTSKPQGFAAVDGKPVAYLDSTEVPHGIKSFNPCRKQNAGGSSPRIERILKQLLNRLGGFVSANEIMIEMLQFLLQGRFIIPSELYGAQKKYRLLQVNQEVLRLRNVPNDKRYRCDVCGTTMHFAADKLPCPFCHGSMIHWDDAEVNENRYVQRIKAKSTIPLVAREHTAQVPSEVRSDIEDDFKAAKENSNVNLLACSPTLEMGIDVGGLDAVVLRNVPPRPDNYAQRGGRAGRRTRVGLVLGYARSTPHDQYFFDKPAEMISGEVPAPAIGLGNRDVILRHLNAIALGITEPGVATKMVEYVTPEGNINQDKVDALKSGVLQNVTPAVAIAIQAWGDSILVEAGLTHEALHQNLLHLPDHIQNVVDRTARQVLELRKPLEVYSKELQNARSGTRAGDLVARLLGIPTNNKSEADDRSAGYPLRRFAEFGILPGYEFPTEPSSLRLLADPHEEEPIQVNRIFGIDQFRPEAQVFARTKRWRVIGLDLSSPWNPASDEPVWKYRKCSICGLRYHGDSPRCPRCKTIAEGYPLDGRGFAGFIAKVDERPILEEEERFAVQNLVRGYPQWDGDVVGRWSVSNGWGLRLSRDEMVYWVNEGTRPSKQDLEDVIPMLHDEGKGFLLCGSCGQILHMDPALLKNGVKAKKSTSKQDPFGHRESCPNAGKTPNACALVASNKAEVLRLIVPVPTSMTSDELKRWGLSLGYSLLAGMRHLYKLDGSEIDFLFEGPWSALDNGLTF
ncbi:MAG: DEAD/DEAH box helicase [bacterium]|nr:DEAD/DEAH box helicase [bacterium]